MSTKQERRWSKSACAETEQLYPGKVIKALPIIVCAAAAFALSAPFFGDASHAIAQQAPASPPPDAFQWPARMTNPQVMPDNTPPERIRELMQRFTASLGVRCSYCHVGTEGQPLSTYDFASDANPKKNVARAMMRLSWRLNTEDLPAIETLNAPRIGCYTCHRGSIRPEADPPSRT